MTGINVNKVSYSLDTIIECAYLVDSFIDFT